MNEEAGSMGGQSGEERATAQHKLYPHVSLSFLEYGIPQKAKR